MRVEKLVPVASTRYGSVSCCAAAARGSLLHIHTAAIYCMSEAPPSESGCGSGLRLVDLALLWASEVGAGQLSSASGEQECKYRASPGLGTFDPHPATPGLDRLRRTSTGYAGDKHRIFRDVEVPKNEWRALPVPRHRPVRPLSRASTALAFRPVRPLEPAQRSLSETKKLVHGRTPNYRGSELRTKGPQNTCKSY